MPALDEAPIRNGAHLDTRKRARQAQRDEHEEKLHRARGMLSKQRKRESGESDGKSVFFFKVVTVETKRQGRGEKKKHAGDVVEALVDVDAIAAAPPLALPPMFVQIRSPFGLIDFRSPAPGASRAAAGNVMTPALVVRIPAPSEHRGEHRELARGELLVELIKGGIVKKNIRMNILSSLLPRDRESGVLFFFLWSFFFLVRRPRR